mmetsp:Transcript_24367/g.56627  ORF Transcript_24367/g.56627 Transcript_24367/m.56627 type:complete len:303 (+) Transcript_24367:81-989(+)
MGCSNSSAAQAAETITVHDPLKPSQQQQRHDPEVEDAFEAAEAPASPAPGVEPREMDDALFEILVGSQGPQGGSSSSRPAAKPAVRNLPPNGAPAPRSGSSGKLPKDMSQVSAAAVRAAAQAGVPLPLAGDEDDEYGHVDNYVDDLLGTPMKDRPEEWRNRSIEAAAEAALSAEMPNIIFANGRKGPPLEAKPEMPRLKEQEPIEMSYPDPSQLSTQVSPYLNGVLTGWATVDLPALDSKGADGPAEGVKTAAPADPRPQPKESAASLGDAPAAAAAAAAAAAPRPKAKAKAKQKVSQANRV